MTKDRIVAELRRLKPELEAAGVTHIALFGSVARGTEGESSDIDLLAEFDERVSLLDIVRLQCDLSERFGRPVDLIEARALKSSARQAARTEQVDAF